MYIYAINFLLMLGDEELHFYLSLKIFKIKENTFAPLWSG